jgi:TPR repeat protein
MKTIQRTVSFALVIALAQVMSAQADMFNDGFAAYKLGDYATALKFWRPLAEQGDASAQVKLGLMYEIGQGVLKDDAEAVKWYRNAAERGVAEAQANLGYMYSSGRGLPKDRHEAIKWYRKAAKQGHAAAQNSLGIMYARGEGAPKDNFLAYMWFFLAAELSDNEARKNRDLMVPLLTREQVVKAERMAREWMAEQQQ